MATRLIDIINPEVMGDMIEAKIEALCKFVPYAKLDTTLEGVPGDTKTVPAWNYIGDAEDYDFEAGEEIEPTKLTASSTEFKIKSIGKSVGIYQKAINSGLGNPIGQAETQLAKSIFGKVDNDTLDAIYTSKNIYAAESLAKISYVGIVDAVTKFEDEEDGIEKVMFINPAQESTILKDGDFLSADKFEAGVAVRGSIGKVAGAWVKKSKKVRLVTAERAEGGSVTITAENLKEYQAKVDPATVLVVGDTVNDLTAANQYYLCPIIKMEPDSDETEYTEDELPAVTIFLKEDTQVDHEWFPKKQRHDVTATKYYGVALTNASKVVLAKFKK